MYHNNPSPNHNRKLDDVSGEEHVLLGMIDEGEHQTQDFKFRIDSSQKIAKTLCAFANTDGGRLLIGVKDNGRIAGIDPEEEYFMIDGAAALYTKPEIKFNSRVFCSEDKFVLEIDIPSSPEKPHFAREENKRWIAYVRQKDENFVANRVLLTYLKDKTTNKSSRKNLIAYGQHERLLFDFLSENEDISLSKFSNLAKIPVHKAEKILAMFLKWEVVNWRATEKGIRFYLIQ